MGSLYEQYGRMLVEAEILQGRINEVKRQIAEELGKNGSNKSPAGSEPTTDK
jgi:hypothetical protein